MCYLWYVHKEGGEVKKRKTSCILFDERSPSDVCLCLCPILEQLFISSGRRKNIMGQTSSSSSSSKLDLAKEARYLSEHTDLTEEDVRRLHGEFAAKNKMNKKEFLREFKKTYPK